MNAKMINKKKFFILFYFISDDYQFVAFILGAAQLIKGIINISSSALVYIPREGI